MQCPCPCRSGVRNGISLNPSLARASATSAACDCASVVPREGNLTSARGPAAARASRPSPEELVRSRGATRWVQPGADAAPCFGWETDDGRGVGPSLCRHFKQCPFVLLALKMGSVVNKHTVGPTMNLKPCCTFRPKSSKESRASTASEASALRLEHQKESKTFID